MLQSTDDTYEHVKAVRKSFFARLLLVAADWPLGDIVVRVPSQ